MNYSKIEKYKELKLQKETIEAEMKLLNNEIVDEMINEGVNKIETPNGIIAQVVTKESLSYDDEIATIKYLKENNLEKYIKETIDTKALNAEVKKSNLLKESLKPTSKISYSLTVK